MKKGTILRRLTLGFASGILLTLALGAFAGWRFLGLRRSVAGLAEDTVPRLVLLGECSSVAKDNMIATQAHLQDDSDAHMGALERQIAAGVQRRADLFAAYERLLVDDEDSRLFKEAKTRVGAYADARTRMLALSRQHDKAGARAVFGAEVGPAFAAYDRALRAEIDYNAGLAAVAGGAGKAAADSGVRLMIAAQVVATVGGIILAWLISRGISHSLRAVATGLGTGAEQIVAAASQVSASSQSLAEGSSEQAASLEETSSSLEELSSMTKRNAANAASAKQLSGETRAAAEAGNGDMTAMRQAMDAIKASSNDIAKIIKTIDEIAFQTNILALNAAVEAARAGEAGAGFAVVAEEVRALAQRSAESAKETAAKIEVAIRNGEQGVQISEKVAQSLGVIADKARQVDELVAEITTASSEQSQGISQINTAVSQMDKVTQANASGAEESAAAAEELNAQAVCLKETVAELQFLAGGRAAGTADPDAATAGEPPVAPAPAKTARPGKPGAFNRWPAAAMGSRANGIRPSPSANGHTENFFKDS